MQSANLISDHNEDIFQSMVEGLKNTFFFYSINEKGAFIYISPSITNVLNYGPAEFLANYTEYLTDSSLTEKSRRHSELRINGKKQAPYELEVYHKDGCIRTLEVEETPIFDRNHKMIAAEGIAHDITKRKMGENRKELQKKLSQAQKLEALGTLAGGIAHDFNNILSAIIGHAELSMLELPKTHTVMNNLDSILKAGERAKELVKQILAFSRKTDQNLKPVTVKLVAREALKLLRATLPSSIEIIQNLESNSQIKADSTQIHQILMNLFTNSGYAMQHRGGTLEICLQDVHLDLEFCSRFPNINPGEYIELMVSDTGEGMPAEVLNRIYDPFFSTKEWDKGSGMGLAVVQNIVKSLNGHIMAHSQPGKGSTFKIFLPVIKAEFSSDLKNFCALPGGKSVSFL